MTVTAPPRTPEPHDLLDPVEYDQPVGHDNPEALIEEARRRTRTRRRWYAALALTTAAIGLGVYFGLANSGTSLTSAAGAPATPSPLRASDEAPFEVWFVRGSNPAAPDGYGPCCWVFPTWRTAAQLGISPDEDIYTRSQLNTPDENRRATHLLGSVLKNLIAGPTPGDEANASWDSNFPPTTRLRDVTLTNGIVSIDIASQRVVPPETDTTSLAESVWNQPGKFDYLYGQGIVPLHRLSQLVFTVTQFPFVKGVRFKLDGLLVNVPADESFLGRTDGSPIPGPYLGRPVTRNDYTETTALWWHSRAKGPSQ